MLRVEKPVRHTVLDRSIEQIARQITGNRITPLTQIIGLCRFGVFS
jgi:hypothetical protein